MTERDDWDDWDADLRPAQGRGRRRGSPPTKTSSERLDAVEAGLRELSASVEDLRATIARMAADAAAKDRSGWFRSRRMRP